MQACVEKEASLEAAGIETGQDLHHPAGTLVIGIGNSLLCDDGAGVHVIEKLSHQTLPEDVEILDGGTLSFTLLEQVENCAHLIIVDAAELGALPGTIQVFHDQELDQFLATNNRPSVHEVNLLDVLTAARFRGRYPPRCSMVGIQPENVDWSSTPSPAVAGAVNEAAAIIAKLLGAKS
ncbi:MAG: HyaD/HybD family hydrogenase maturation endopeptidase [Wenzhouxiangellaceae bacterium]|nr:HyaD/HybD family hydrogenase maturation endopeptidase [Wenzhouxiangellaceae bacterium]